MGLGDFGTGATESLTRDYFGTRGHISADMAFTLIGTQVPEPGSLIMLGTGVLGLAGVIRRKLF